jgi:hypothetical protein
VTDLNGTQQQEKCFSHPGNGAFGAIFGGFASFGRSRLTLWGDLPA